jgi:exodeoxyribonuclease-3
VIGNLYLPNGNPAPGPKFDYKLSWFSRLRHYAQALAETEDPAMLCGDFNVVPTDIDAVVPRRWVADAVSFPESREAYAQLLADGWTDALRRLHPEKGIYTYWNFGFRGGYDKSSGLRMDHLLLNRAAAARLQSAGVDVAVRGWDKPSDHAPAWIELGAGFQQN